MDRVLVVDDEPELLRAMVLNLTQRDYLVTTAATGGEAVLAATRICPDLMVLDLGLPDLDGLEVLRQVHDQRPDLPILILSARTSSSEKVAALDLGAVDYVTKPFDMAELVARLRAATRRRNHVTPRPTLATIGGTRIDLDAMTAQRVDHEPPEPVHLTATEWRMLEILLSQPGTLITPSELLTAMRGDSPSTDSSYLRIYMRNLRRKLESSPDRPRHLLTEPGMGYRYRP
jgi:two-component system KDP operon response regulator KdpE